MAAAAQQSAQWRVHAIIRRLSGFSHTDADAAGPLAANRCLAKSCWLVIIVEVRCPSFVMGLPWRGRGYSASFIRDSWTTFAQRGISAWIADANSSGEFPIGCISSSSNFLRKLVSARTFTVS
jgi:hypothetical protein